MASCRHGMFSPADIELHGADTIDDHPRCRGLVRILVESFATFLAEDLMCLPHERVRLGPNSCAGPSSAARICRSLGRSPRLCPDTSSSSCAGSSRSMYSHFAFGLRRHDARQLAPPNDSSPRAIASWIGGRSSITATRRRSSDARCVAELAVPYTRGGSHSRSAAARCMLPAFSAQPPLRGPARHGPSRCV